MTFESNDANAVVCARGVYVRRCSRRNSMIRKSLPSIATRWVDTGFPRDKREAFCEEIVLKQQAKGSPDFSVAQKSGTG
jgi:hypothetical protein